MIGTSTPCSSHSSMQPALLGQPDVVGLAGLARAHVGGDDLDRVADQQHVAEAQRPAQVHVAGDVVRHVLGVVDAAAGRQRLGQAGDGHVEIGGLGGDDLLARRVVDAGPREVGRVQRLVDDDRVGAVLERPHHRRGDVPRPGPHRHANGVGHGATRAATSASTSSRYSACRRSTIGPRRPSPIVRPSTDRTGTTPANVPVTNASRAE